MNFTRSGSISFGVAIEAFIKSPAVLYESDEQGEIIPSDDKHIVFYIDVDNPRHLRPYFSGTQTALSLHIDFIEYMLISRQFLYKDAIKQMVDMRDVAGILHFLPDFHEHRRIYLDKESFEHLFGGHAGSKHKATDENGRTQRINYHDDGVIGTISVLRICRKRPRVMSAKDLYIADRFKTLPQKCVAVHEGRGWLWIIDVSY